MKNIILCCVPKFCSYLLLVSDFNFFAKKKKKKNHNFFLGLFVFYFVASGLPYPMVDGPVFHNEDELPGSFFHTMKNIILCCLPYTFSYLLLVFAKKKK